MRVRLPSLVDSYTGGLREVDLPAGDLAAVFAGLEARFPGVRFRLVDEHGRLRTHINVFVNADAERDLSRPLRPGDQVMIVGALSGG
ncbi:MAG: MoaD/ThiS family protein [Planctomycetaceae bacterium]|nr:MoaD/ThiS family protein [Planctomycetaceae bacterium]